VSTVAALVQKLADERFEAALGKELAVRPQAVVADQPRSPLDWGEVRARHAQRSRWQRRYDHHVRRAREALIAWRLIVVLWAREARARHAQRTWWRRRYDHLRAVIALRLIVLWLREVHSPHTNRGQTWRLVRNTTASVIAAAALLYVGWQSW
jgi:hypothetical protein